MTRDVQGRSSLARSGHNSASLAVGRRSALVGLGGVKAASLMLSGLTLAMSASFSSKALAQNVVVNPGFENVVGGEGASAFVGWSDPGNSFSATPYAHSGNYAAETGIVGRTAPLYQDIALGAGRYQLSFFASVGGSSGPVGGEGGTRILRVSLGGQQLLNQVDPPANTPYQFYAFNYTQAVTGISRLEFDVQNDPSGTSIDDVSLILLTSTPNLIAFAQTQNQREVANGLNMALAGASLSTAGSSIQSAFSNIDPGAIPAALDALSGEGIIAAQNAAHRQVEEFTSSIFDQTTFYGGGGTANSITLTAPQPGAGFFALAPAGNGTAQFTHAPIRELADLPSTRAAPPPPAFAPTRTWRAWATGFGGAENLSGQAGIGSATQRDTIYGGTLGVDYQLLPNYLAGIAIGGSDGTFDVAGRATSGSTTGGHIAFYDLATFGAFYGASSNSFSYFTNRTTRNIAGFGGLAGETDRGDFDSHEFRTRLEFGRHFGGADLARFGVGGVVTPFIALELADLRSNGFAERNLAGPTVLGLNVQGQSSASVPSFVGLRYQGVAALGNGMVLSPSLQIAYVHEFAPQRTQIGGLINLPGSIFLVDGARPSRNAVQAKAGAEMAIGPHSTIFATFDGEFSGQAQFYGGKGGFKYLF